MAREARRLSETGIYHVVFRGGIIWGRFFLIDKVDCTIKSNNINKKVWRQEKYQDKLEQRATLIYTT
jgi:hypothetical protein